MRVMTTALPTIMISGRCRFRFCARHIGLRIMAIFVAVAACHSAERKGENPDPESGGHFKATG
jgi:hypothetical protein